MHISLLSGNCYIKDFEKHAYNQKLIQELIEQELGKDLGSRIKDIAKELLQRGFKPEAYGISESQTKLVFNCLPVWEGKQHSVPVTFFLYFWPAEKIALEREPSGKRYASDIHSHPIPCSFAVLHGTLCQENYQLGAHRKVNCTGEDLFRQGEGDIDDLRFPFIHKLYNKGDSALTISLHAYGLENAERVYDCFNATYSQHCY